MSSYMKMTKHPQTGKWEMAQWLDDYFGQHRYGIRFPSEPDRTFREGDHEWETKEGTK